MTKPSEGSKELTKQLMDWHSFYDEAMANLPEETRKFVESTSWAEELHQAEREKLATQAVQAHVKAEIRKTLERLKDELLASPSMPPDCPKTCSKDHWHHVAIKNVRLAIDNEIKSLEER